MAGVELEIDGTDELPFRLTLVGVAHFLKIIFFGYVLGQRELYIATRFNSFSVKA